MAESTFKTLVYSPDCRILIEGVDVSKDLVRGQVSRVTGGASAISFTLSNKDLRYNDKFRRMDRVVVWMKRITPILVFSGYLDSVPGLQLYPSTVTIKASCTLKRLLHTYWDPSLQASQTLLGMQYALFGGAAFGTAGASGTTTPATGTPNDDASTDPGDPDDPLDGGSVPGGVPNTDSGGGDNSNSGTTPDAGGAAVTPDSGWMKDTGLGDMLKQVLIKVGGWTPDQVKVQEFPTTFLGYIQEQMPAIENLDADSLAEFKKLFEFDESGTSGNGTGSTGGGNLSDSTFTTIGPPANGSNYNDMEIVWIVTNAGWRGEDVVIGSSIITAESSGNPAAVNTANSDGSTDRGLWQINSIHDDMLPGENRMDPAVSTRIARQLYQNRGNWDDWSTLVYHGTAQQHFDKFRAIVGTGGTPPPGSGATTGSTTSPATTKPGGFGGAQTNGSVPGTGSTPSQPGTATTPAGDMINSDTLPPAPWENDNIQPDTRRWLRIVHHKWPDITDVGTYRPQDAYPDHPSGRAADNMTTDMNIGNQMRDFAHANAGALGLEYTIWQQEYWAAGNGGRNMMEDRGSPTQNHQDHVHITFIGNAGTGGMMDGSTSSGGGTGTGGSTGSTQSTFNNKLAKNIFTFLFNPQSYASSMGEAFTGRYASVNDEPLINIVRTLVEGRMCEFQSLPDGRFSAFYPDYFGLDGTAPVLKLEDVEMKNVQIMIQDDALTTHVFTQGAESMTGGVSMQGELGYLRSPGVVTIEDEWLFKRATEGSFFKPDVADAVEMLKRYGVRPLKKTYNNIFSLGAPESLLVVAIKLFMQKWAEQYQTSVDLTFMPELYPGMRVELVGHDLIVYVKSVTHTFDFENGFTTSAQVMAPMSVSRSPLTGSNPNGTTRAADQDDVTPSGAN